MSELPADRASLSHSHCNGISDLKNMEGSKVVPNGLHTVISTEVVSKELKDLVRSDEDGVKTEYSSQDKIMKSTNELIDKFSATMALSLINSNQCNDQINASETNLPKEATRNYDNLSAANGETSQLTNMLTDSTVKFPLSKTDSSGYTVMEKDGIMYMRYESERQMAAIMQLITKDLSEPYSIYTYRYFIHNWPHLCFLAMHESEYVGAIVCKLDLHKKITRRGYIAMLAVDKTVRRKRIGTNLVKMAIETMNIEGCDEVVLETEVTNQPALKLYENLGFVRDKRLFRYYLNGVDALRLKLWLR
ncbi:N-alpha-acetyltransferase 30-like [Styela clava]|uniref:N-alpha-acetyltransferase 30-like n=1 Tax=Styela clava TaxID=7725 RepID=UPI00193A090E|nr:N-alpha-acetyltransferase 30-like [Styela clava]